MYNIMNILRRAASLAAVFIIAAAPVGGSFTASADSTHTESSAVQSISKKKKKAPVVSDRYYRVSKNVKLFKKTSKGIKSAKLRTDKPFFVSGKPAKANGNLLREGQDEDTAAYIKLTSGIYAGYYIPEYAGCEWEDEVYAKQRIVTEYGRSMNGGSYSYGAAGYRCTDCSGLTMQCYEQIGYYMAHSTVSQSHEGKGVKLRDAEPGDIIVLNYCSHVALYLGGGKMVHAMNSYDGIKVEPISQLKYYHVDTVRRIIR